ncbi:MAG: glucose-1-phosphate adenylyltransferase [Candidatus Hydrogenedentes bacterium]|nr:glucose-1-phosphate adenylyltransferase [Candidatus Hydrogenedentota bacterium]
MNHVLAVLLAGGAGERLYPLTKNRAKPAVPFGGIYRIIDFTLSNCMNSNCRRVQVMVQYKSNSLVRHIRSAWDIMRPEFGEYIDIIPPQMRVNHSWYLGTADAIYQNLYTIDQDDVQEVLILSGDHIYKMDYMRMLQFHRETEADVTIATIEYPKAHGHQFGIIDADESGRVKGFLEKPQDPPTVPGNPNVCQVSMGIYVFNRNILKQVVCADAERDTSHDFGRDIIPRLIDTHRVYTYHFRDENRKESKYWRDVGTIDSYWEANMDLVAVDPMFNLYDKQWPVRTHVQQLPPAKFVFGDLGQRFGAAVDSIVGPGSIISGGLVKRSVLGPEVRVNSYSHVEESILFSGVQIGRHARVRRAIIEKNVVIPEYATIGYDLQYDARHYRVTENGVVVVESAIPNEVAVK